MTDNNWISYKTTISGYMIIITERCHFHSFLMDMFFSESFCIICSEREGLFQNSFRAL